MRKSELIFLWLFSVLGIAFWFFIGFPFAHSHESYYWMGEYFSKSFFDFIFEPIGHYASFRPLGQIVSAALFELSNRSLLLVQLFNFIVTISSLWLILNSVKEKKIFSIIFLITGGTLFASFAYLFHLHGLYYSPVLLFIAILIHYYYQPLSIKNIYIIFISALTAALFHPFSIFIYVFYMVGLLIEKKNDIDRKRFFYAAVNVVLLILLSFILVPNQSIFLSWSNFQGLMNIYRSMQINHSITIIIFAMGILTILGVPVDKRGKIIFAFSLAIISVLFYIMRLPMLLSVFIAGFFKLFYTRRWALLMLLIVTFMFSVFTDIESGHLKFYVLFIIALITSINLSLPHLESYFKPVYGSVLIIIATSIVILLRNDIKLPAISRFAGPLLATRESSYNLENVLKWYLKSDYLKYGIELNNHSEQNMPASNENLQKYLNSIRGITPLNYDKKLVVFFNKKAPQNVIPLYTIKGKYAENVYVYLKNI